MRHALFAFVLAAAALAGGEASAAHVDFRTAPFHAGHGLPSFDIDVDGTTFRFEAMPQGSVLYHAKADGYGVDSPFSYEPDEIEGPEVLSLSFWSGASAKALKLDSIHLTDLFNERSLETGRIELHGPDGVTVINVIAALDQVRNTTNGELWVKLGGIAVHELRFTAPGRVNGNGEEYSVAGVGVRPMPEPTASLAFCIGSLLVSAALRRRREEADLG
jgi:hypothetical protein